MTKSASPEVAAFLIKRAISPGAAAVLKAMIAPAVVGGGVGGVTGLMRAEDSSLVGGLTGALAGAGLGAAGGAAGGMLGSRAGRFFGGKLKNQVPLGRKGVRTLADRNIGPERAIYYDLGGRGRNTVLRALGINPWNPKTTVQELLGSGVGTIGGAGLGSLLGGYYGGRIGESIGTE